MSNLEAFKQALQDEKFREKFSNISNLEEALEIAKENGYNLNKDEVLKDNELREDMLDAVAGGAKYVQHENNSLINSGDGSHVYIASKKS